MIAIMRWLFPCMGARERYRDRRRVLEGTVAARDDHLKKLEEMIARTKSELGVVVPQGPGGGLVHHAERRLVKLRSDMDWVSGVQRAEFEIATAKGIAGGASVDESLAMLAASSSEVEAKVAEELRALEAVLQAGASAGRNASALEHVTPDTLANMVLFTPALAEEVFAGHGEMEGARDQSTRRAAVVLDRRQGHMRLCSNLPHRRRPSARVQAHVESASTVVDCGSIVALGGAHRAVSVAMVEIHGEQFGSARR